MGRKKKANGEEEKATKFLVAVCRIPCAGCGRKLEPDELVNIAYATPHDYMLCGRCNHLTRTQRRAVLDNIIRRIL